MANKIYRIKQGDLFQKTVQFNLTGFDFTNCNVRCHLVNSSNRKVDELSVNVLSNTLGQLVVQLQANETKTKKWVGTLKGDIEIKRTSPAFGPYTPAEIQIEVKPSYTN